MRECVHGAPSRYRAVFAAIAIALAASAAFAPAFGAGFVYDDHNFVERGADVHGPLTKIWTHPESLDYWPLTWTSFWVESRIFQDDPRAFHATNVLLHVLVSLLLWRVLAGLRVPGAALAGLLFAVHPVAVESVAWISERKNTLSAVLALAATLQWIRFEGSQRSRDGVASLLSFILACLAKTSVVMLPFVLLGISAYRSGGIPRRRWAWLVPFFATALAMGIVTIHFQWNRAMPANVPAAHTPVGRVASAAWALLFYVRTAFVPAGLAFVYPDWPVAPQSPLFYAPLAGIAVVGILLWRWRRPARKPLLLGLGYHALMVAPVLGFFDMAYFWVAPVSNHLQYLALMGPAALVAMGIALLAARWRTAGIAVAVALVAICGATTYRRAATFQSDTTLWAAAARDAPQSFYAVVLHTDLLGMDGRLEDALRELSAFVQRSRDPAASHRGRAVLLFHQRSYAECVSELRTAAALRPFPAFDVKMGEQLLDVGRSAEAIELLSPIVKSAPRYVDARLWLQDALTEAGRLDEAAAILRDGIRILPGENGLEDALSQVEERMRWNGGTRR